MNPFSAEIENIIRTKNIPYIDAILEFSEIKELDLELVADFIKKDPLLLSKVRLEAENLNILKKGARLPI